MGDSTHSTKGRTFVFADRRSTFKGSQTLQKNKKSTEIDNKSLQQCFANAQQRENSIFPLPDATWCRFWSPRRAPRRSRAPFLVSRGTLGDSPDTPAARRGRSGMLPRRSQSGQGGPITAPRRPGDTRGTPPGRDGQGSSGDAQDCSGGICGCSSSIREGPGRLWA